MGLCTWLALGTPRLGPQCVPPTWGHGSHQWVTHVALMLYHPAPVPQGLSISRSLSNDAVCQVVVPPRDMSNQNFRMGPYLEEDSLQMKLR